MQAVDCNMFLVPYQIPQDPFSQFGKCAHLSDAVGAPDHGSHLKPSLGHCPSVIEATLPRRVWMLSQGVWMLSPYCSPSNGH